MFFNFPENSLSKNVQSFAVRCQPDVLKSSAIGNKVAPAFNLTDTLMHHINLTQRAFQEATLAQHYTPALYNTKSAESVGTDFLILRAMHEFSLPIFEGIIYSTTYNLLCLSHLAWKTIQNICLSNYEAFPDFLS